VAPGDVTLLGLPNELSQVLLNLLVNAKDAIQSTRADGGEVELSVRAEGGEGLVRVRDNGGGIAPAVLGHLFDPFFTTRPGGTGIGLYMSKMIIERMEGRIRAQNVEGGALFELTCPLAP
jgi:signal transduction histidine kinase